MMKLKILFIHVKILSHRKVMCEALIKKLKESKKMSVDVEFIEEYDPLHVSSTDLKQFIDLSRLNTNDIFDQLIRNIHIKQISNALKHYSALYKANEYKDKYDYFLILEDDVLYGDDIAMRLERLLSLSSDEDFDVLFTGQPSTDPIVSESFNIKPINSMFKILLCCDSYIIKSSQIKSILDKFLPIKFKTNIHFSFLSDKYKDLKLKMCIPNIFIDGSKFGVYLSTLEANNKLFLYPEYNKLESLVKKEELTQDDMISIDQIIKNIRFSNHPDIQFLFGLYDLKKQNFQKAKQVFEEVYNVYLQNGCIVNNESEFLQTYLSIFKHFQE